MEKAYYNKGNSRKKGGWTSNENFKRYDHWSDSGDGSKHGRYPDGRWNALHRLPSAQGESLEEAAWVHGIDPDLLVARVNAFLESQEAAQADK